jgi:hypothetical protein
LAAFDFILNSAEFKNFARPQGDIDKLLSSMPKMTWPQTVDRMKESLKIEEHMYNLVQKNQFD